MLADQVGRVSIVTTRSAGLTAAAALAGSVIGAQITTKIEIRWWVIVVLALATLAGIVVLLGAPLEAGPSADGLLIWEVLHPTQLAELVLLAKAIAVRANRSRVQFVDVAFYVQAILVAAAVVVALVSVRIG